MNENLPKETARLIVEDHGDILLLLRPDTARSRRGEWDLPGGSVDDKETPEQAACRETFEEAKLRVSTDDVERISTTVERDGERTFVRHYWYAGGLVTRKSVEISNEHRDYKWVPIARAGEYITYAPHLVAIEHSLRG